MARRSAAQLGVVGNAHGQIAVVVPSQDVKPLGGPTILISGPPQRFSGKSVAIEQSADVQTLLKSQHTADVATASNQCMSAAATPSVAPPDHALRARAETFE